MSEGHFLFREQVGAAAKAVDAVAKAARSVEVRTIMYVESN